MINAVELGCSRGFDVNLQLIILADGLVIVDRWCDASDQAHANCVIKLLVEGERSSLRPPKVGGGNLRSSLLRKLVSRLLTNWVRTRSARSGYPCNDFMPVDRSKDRRSISHTSWDRPGNPFTVREPHGF